MSYRNRKNKKLFTDLFTEFVFERKLDVQTALNILAKKNTSKNKKVVLAARDLQNTLKSGGSLSYGLKVCSYINFDSVYVSFIRFAERSGNLCDVMNFLKMRCKREEENEGKVIEAAVYPVFVIILMVVVAALFLYYFSSFFDSSFAGGVEAENMYSSLILAFSFLIIFCVVSFVWLKKTLGANKLYEAFLAVGFLVKGGECLAVAVGDAVNILGFDSKEGKMFAKAKENLSYGISLENSFVINSWSKALRSEMEDAFFYAQNTGGETDVFERIATWLNKQNEKRRMICFKLLEPFFISGTGIFLFIFLVNIIVPFFSQTFIL